jgi:hypothetical protein
MDGMHMGQLLKEAINRSGLKVKDIAVALGTRQETIYHWFELETIDKSIMERISRLICDDSSSGEHKASIITTEAALISPLQNDIYWKDKYVYLLEHYADLIKNINKQ